MSTADAEHPWLGLDSFTEETRQFFHGREEEVAELARRVQRKALTILFGQSGLGKTSILRAGIVPRLRPEGYCPVYVRIDYSPDSPPPSEQIKQAIFRATEASGSWTQPGAAVAGESLWEFLHHRDDILRDANGRTIVPLLIFDQFEEIFTIAQSDDASRERAAEFIADLADLVENRPPRALEERLEQDDSITERFDFGRADYRILIALREDYLAHLEAFKGAMPSITQNRMRLARMTGQQALAAVIKPGGRLVTQEVAEAIVRFIAGGSELRNAEVEPSLLSLICRELNNARLAQQRKEISADLLAGSHDTILNEFYERALSDQPSAVRQFVEDEMLTESGYRESIAEERVLKAFGGNGTDATTTLATLVNRRLLRIEERLDLRRVELTHDVLCPVVSASRDRRHEREVRDAAERALAQQREREAATRRALVRARQVAAGCAALALVAVGAGVFGYVGMKNAQKAEDRAQYVRGLAESARGESERLIIYLLDDFYRELEPVGRIDIMGELARRAIDYYDNLPPELNTTNTERNRALALVRYGAVLRNQSKLDEAAPALDDAIGTLQRLHDAGDATETTTVGLSLGLMARARVADMNTGSSEGLPFAERALEVIRPAGEAAGASVSARRTLGLALTQLGFLQLRRGQYEPSLLLLQRAREMFRGIDGLQLEDTDAAANFGITTGWYLEGLIQLGRNDEARAAGDEARAIIAGILERQPTHMQALRAGALIAAMLGQVEFDEMRLGPALAHERESLAGWETLVRVDPSNSVAFNNLGASRARTAQIYDALGRPREALRNLEPSSVLEPVAERSVMVAGMLSGLRFNMAIHTAELADNERSAQLMQDAERLFGVWRKEFKPGSFDARFQDLNLDVSRIELAYSRGEAQHALQTGARLQASIDALEPSDDNERLQCDTLSRRLGLVLAQAAEALRDDAAIEAAARIAVERSARLPNATVFDSRQHALARTLQAIGLARTGRADEARTVLEPALALQRELYAREHEDQFQHLELAQALYAAALADPVRADMLLGEARRLVAALPAGMRDMRSVAHWQRRIEGTAGS